MKTFGYIIAGLLIIAALIGLSFGMETMSIAWKSHFNPQHENVKRETYEASRSFNVGKRQELAKYMYTFNSTTDASVKAATAQMVRLNFAEYNTNELPLEMQDFVTKCNSY